MHLQHQLNFFDFLQKFHDSKTPRQWVKCQSAEGHLAYKVDGALTLAQVVSHEPHDTLHNDTKHNDTQYNDTYCNDIQPKNK